MSRTFDCDICGKKFSMKCYLQQHIGTHDKKKKCRICKKFVSNMKVHIGSVHIYGKRIPCAICGEMISKTFMKRHISARHVEKPKKFKCEDCDEAFVYKSKLIEHKKKEHGFKAFTCHCGYANDWITKFKEHQKVHVGSSSTYLCPVSMHYKV